MAACQQTTGQNVMNGKLFSLGMDFMNEVTTMNPPGPS